MTTIPRSKGDRGTAAVPAPAAEPAELAARPSPRPWIGGFLAVLVIPILIATSLTWGAGAGGAVARAASAQEVSPAELEQAYGIRVNLVAVTAAGGLVDVRFTVLDATKAANLFHNGSTSPRLFVQATGALLRAPEPHAHKLNILDGASYFFLFPNAGGAVQSGTAVSVVVGDIKLAPISAQS